MGEIKIQVLPSKLKSLQVGTRNVKTPIKIEENPTHYYSTLAKQWAVLMNGMVQDEDYSSKYWANQAKQSAEASKAAGETAANLGDLLNENYVNYSNELQEATQAGIENIEQTQDDILIKIDAAKEEINTTTIKSISDITETKLNSLGEIDKEANTQINNIKSTGFYMEDGILYYIDENGETKKFTSGASLPLFTPVIQDHILSFEESKGLALQGTYVYKTGVAGSRYGYPDFVRKCIDEKTAGTASQVTLGENTITMHTNANGHIFYDIADKAAVDTWFDTWGVADFYGIDTENERIFLPRNNKFMQLTTDTSKVNEFNEAGLPDHDHTVTMLKTNKSGQDTGTVWSWSEAHNGSGSIITSGVNDKSVYGKSDTVQVASSNKLLYYVVGNTEVASSETNVVDITSSENDNIPLGFSTYQGENIQASSAWLASNSQWNSGKIYKTFYNHYTLLIGQAFCEGYVRNHTDEYTDFDLVINQDDETFRLPLLNGEEDLPSDKFDNLELKPTGQTYTAPANGEFYISATMGTGGWIKFILNGDMYIVGPELNGAIDVSNRITCKKGDVIQVEYYALNTLMSFKFNYFTANGTLYFKVGNALQNQELIDIAAVTTTLAEKIGRNECKAFITETYINGDSGYIIYSNKLCEQWGVSPNVNGTTGYADVTLIKNYANSNYNVVLGNISKGAYSPGAASIGVSAKNLGNFSICKTWNGGNYVNSTYWRTIGVIE